MNFYIMIATIMAVAISSSQHERLNKKDNLIILAMSIGWPITLASMVYLELKGEY